MHLCMPSELRFLKAELPRHCRLHVRHGLESRGEAESEQRCFRLEADCLS